MIYYLSILEDIKTYFKKIVVTTLTATNERLDEITLGYRKYVHEGLNYDLVSECDFTYSRSKLHLLHHFLCRSSQSPGPETYFYPNSKTVASDIIR